MSTRLKMVFGLSLWIACALAQAGDEKFSPAALLEFQDEPGHFIFIGRETANQNVHVFEIEHGKKVEWAMQNNRSVVYFDGGSMDLYLNDGTRVFVPASDRNYLGERSGPTMTYPHRPRESLTPLKLTQESFERARVLDIVHADFFKPAPSRERPAGPVFLKDPSHSSLIIVKIKKGEDGRDIVRGYEQDKNIEAILKRYEPGLAYFLKEGGSLFAEQFTVACDHSIQAELIKEISALEGLEVESIQQIQDGIAFDLSQKDAAKAALEVIKGNGKFGTKINVIESILGANVETVFKTAEEKNEFANAAVDLLHELHALHAKVYETAYYERRVEVSNRLGKEGQSGGFWGSANRIYSEARPLVESHAFYEKFGLPLKNAQGSVMALLHHLNTPVSRRLVLLNSSLGNGAGLSWMDKDYLDHWLDWLNSAIGEASGVDPALLPSERFEAGWRGGNSSGGIYDHLKVSGSLTFWSKKEGSATENYDLDRLPANPLVLLGLNADAKAAKKKILQFIIQADAVVAQQLKVENDVNQLEEFVKAIQMPKVGQFAVREYWKTGSISDASFAKLQAIQPDMNYRSKGDWLNTLRMYHEHVSGRAISRFITGNMILDGFIRKVVHSANSFRDFHDFSVEKYHGNALDIVTELVETNSISLKNDGTYHAILDAALGLSNDLENEYGFDGHKSPEVSKKLIRLSAAIQRNFVRVAQYLEAGTPTCELLLGINPHATWMKTRGK